jgi:hypothetical protein
LRNELPRLIAGLLLAGTTLSAPPLAAQAAEECIGAHAEGQVLRSKGSLLLARERFRTCAAESCPGLIRGECSTLASDVDAALPTVVLVAVSGREQDVGAASVRIDEKADWLTLDGRAVPLDPGQHRFTFQLQDKRTQVVSVLLREAEKYRRVVARFDALPAEPSAGRGVHPLVYVFGGLGVVAGGSFAYFAVNGRAREDDLSRCAPLCSEAYRDEFDAMRRNYLAADISLGAAVVSLGLGTYYLLKDWPSDTQPTSKGSKAFALQFSGSVERDRLRLSASTSF